MYLNQVLFAAGNQSVEKFVVSKFRASSRFKSTQTGATESPIAYHNTVLFTPFKRCLYYKMVCKLIRIPMTSVNIGINRSDTHRFSLKSSCCSWPPVVVQLVHFQPIKTPASQSPACSHPLYQMKSLRPNWLAFRTTLSCSSAIWMWPTTMNPCGWSVPSSWTTTWTWLKLTCFGHCFGTGHRWMIAGAGALMTTE